MTDHLLPMLYLMHLADSALPIGAAAHSFGLESLVAEGGLGVAGLHAFAAAYLTEVGALDATYCRAAHRLAAGDHGRADFAADWCALNQRLSAARPARESRNGSAALGRRLLRFAAQAEPIPPLLAAQAALRAMAVEPHHASVFGLVGGALGIDEDAVAGALLQQIALALVSACQRLLPLGQTQAHQIPWRLKPLIGAIVAATADLEPDDATCCAAGLELASMRHPHLQTRLFIS